MRGKGVLDKTRLFLHGNIALGNSIEYPQGMF